MAAIKEIVAINGFIAGMYKQDLSKLSSEMALSALSNASTQVAAVGNLETAIQARDMIKAYGKVFFLAIVELAPRISLVFAQAAHDKDLAHAKQITQQIVEQSKYAAGAEQAKYYSRQLVEQQRQEAALASMSADVAHQISLIDLRYSEWVLAQFGDLTERLDSLLDAIRKELGLESDLERLRKQSQEIRAELLEAVAHMKAKLGLP